MDTVNYLKTISPSDLRDIFNYSYSVRFVTCKYTHRAIKSTTTLVILIFILVVLPGEIRTRRLLFDRLTDRVNRDLHETYGDWGNGRRSEDRCIDGVAANCRAAGNNERDRRSTIIHTRACKAIEQRMIQFVRPMSLSGGTPCHGVQRARAQIGFDLTPRVLPRITH